MKLQRLAGYGPRAAIASGVSMFVFIVILFIAPAIFRSNFVLEVFFGILLLLAMTAWPAALLVVGIDLEWLEHPLTHTGRMQVSLVAAFIAIFLPVIFVVTLIFPGSGNLPSLPMGLLGLALGIFLLIQNWEAKKAKLISGVLPWLGLVAGGGFFLMGIGWLLSFVTDLGFLIALICWLVSTVCFGVWSVWLGIRLQGAKQLPNPSAAQA